LLIMLYHFGNEGPRKLYRFSEIFERGYLATDFFLMLSGYVLGRAYGPALIKSHMSWGRFLLRRVCRVWPGSVIAMALFAAYVLVSTPWLGIAPNPTRFAWPAFWRQMFLVHAWAPLPIALPPADGWNLPSWSLSALLVCYALFPFLWRALQKVRPAWLLPLLGLAVLGAANVATNAVFDHDIYDLFYQFGVFRAVPLFLLGAGLARAAALGWPPEWAARILMWGGLVAVAALQVVGRYDFVSMIAIACVVLGAGRLPVRKPSATIETLAKLSFALFITHTLVSLIYWDQVHGLIFRRPIGLQYQWAMWAAGFPLAIAVAWAFDRWVDMPIQRWLKPWLHERRVQTAPPG
jgi:peptidoglycan/LPS O-acetylase OafA/YrhL